MNTPTTAGDSSTRFLRGAVWMIGARWAMRLIGLVSTIILARLLAPDDFGIIAMAMSVMALIDAARAAGVDLAIIREQANAKDLYDAAWTLNILQGMLIAVLLLLIMPFAVDYFSEPRLDGIFRWLALAALLRSLTNIGTVAFRVALNFRREFLFMLLPKLVVFFFTIAMAVILRDYRALVYSFVANAAVTVVLSYLMHPYRPRLSVHGMGRIWSFSQWLLVSRFAMAINVKGGQLIMGATVSSATLGFYHMGVEIGTLFVEEIVMPVRRALFPNLAKVLNDPPLLIHYSLRAVGVLAIVCLPVGAGLSITSTELTYLLLGEEWLATAPVLRWIAIFGSISGVSLALESLLIVTNRVKWTAVRLWLEALVLIPALLIVAQTRDIEMIAIVRVVIAALFLPLTLHYSVSAVGASWGAFFATLWRPTLAIGAMMLIDHVVLGSLADTLGYLPMLVAHVVLGVLSYCATILLLWALAGRPDSAEAYALGVARGALGRILRR